MEKKLCLHLGNGTVYLGSTDTEEWINIDFVGVLAKDDPELAEHNKTTVEKYYKFPYRSNRYNNVTDMLMDVRKLDAFKDETVDKLLSVNLVDHMKKEEFLTTLKEWKRVLKPGGEIIIDVDDRVKQANMLANAKTIEEIEWGLRLVYCDNIGEGRTHFWGYNPDYLKHVLEQYGFKHLWTREDYIVHEFYPNFQICVQK